MLLDRYLPTSNTVVFHAAMLDAPPDRAWEGMRHFDFFRVPAVRIPNLVRVWPERLWRWIRRREPLPAPRSVTLDDLMAMGAFQPLAEEPGRELVLGSIGRFWTRDFGPVPFTARTFTALAPANCGKIAWGLRVEPFGERRSLLIVDVRVATTDAAAHRHFVWYWRLVGPVVRLMARRGIALVKKTLERAPEAGEKRDLALLLEQQLPSFDVSDVFLQKVEADAATTWASARRADQRKGEAPLSRFKQLAEQPGEEYVVGIIGRFREGNRLQFEPGGFATFDRPGYAKVAFNFVVRPCGPGRSLAITEVRTATTDEAARRLFKRRYGWWLKPLAGLLMRNLLARIRRDAERSARRAARLRLEPVEWVPGRPEPWTLR